MGQSADGYDTLESIYETGVSMNRGIIVTIHAKSLMNFSVLVPCAPTPGLAWLRPSVSAAITAIASAICGEFAEAALFASRALATIIVTGGRSATNATHDAAQRLSMSVNRRQ